MTRTMGWRGTVLLVAIGALGVCSGAALAQGPRPEPAPTGVGGGVQPEPAQRAAPPPAAATRVTQGSSASQQARTGSVSRFQPPVARVGSERTARVRSAPPKKKAVARAARQAPVAKATKHRIERVVKTVAGKATSPDRDLLLLGGAALLVLALGEALFLTLSVRFLRTTAEP